MAMLGKRLQRTVSMSQIGPGSNLHAEKAQAVPSPHPLPPPPPLASPADPASKLPLILQDSTQKMNEQLLLQGAAYQWEALKARQQDDHHLLHYHNAHHHHHHHLHVHQQTSASNPWHALKENGSGPQQNDLSASKQQAPAANQWETFKNAEAMLMKMMMQQSKSHESSGHSSVDDDETRQVLASSPVETYLHLGLASPSSISPAHFLDACFLCKRRLRHERDIFIYRGDIAFCSEDCRHRHILSDETLSLRASRKGEATLGTLAP